MVFTREELLSKDDTRSFPNTAVSAAFLLGGIGTGNVSLGARGNLQDWEIFNKPGKGTNFPNTFFAIRAQEEGQLPVAKVLEGPINPPHTGSHGYYPNTTAGLPRMQSSVLKGEYPVAKVTFADDKLPVKVELQSFTPFIPLNADESGIPCAVLKYRVINKKTSNVDVTLVGSLFNPVGEVSYDKFGNYSLVTGGKNINEFKTDNGVNGLFMYSQMHDESSLHYGNVALTTDHPHVTYKRIWYRGQWFDELQEFWDDLVDDGELTDLGYDTPSGVETDLSDYDTHFAERLSDTGSLGAIQTLKPGEEKVFTFVISWYFPNRLNGWSEEIRVKEPGREITQNYYATMFNSAWDVAQYVFKNYERLESLTFQFHEALFSSTLPAYVLDAVSANIVALRSPTCFRLKDGRFLGYEGSFDEWGCCDGNCTHVWNYAQTLAYLFPELERNMRRTDFLEEVEEDGYMSFRAVKMFEQEWIWKGMKGPAACDGQMGTIMRAYREWLLSGDKEFLEKLWPNIKKALNYALLNWDTDEDLVLDGEQHTTYDIEFFGPNSLCSVMFLGALRATEEMAKVLGDDDFAEKCRQVFKLSQEKVNKLLWNGEYYIQRLEDVDQYKYQYGTGCLSDQVLGQQLAHLFDLGYLLPESNIKKAVSSIYKYNFKTDFTDHVNCQRTYVLGDEQGLLLCSWPHGGRPKFPFVYSDEVWPGIEYHVATHLIYEGFIEEGLTMVKAVRDRHDGFKRNPWNEVECGHHYVRSMASWGLLLALSGYAVDVGAKTMRFSPVLYKDNFKCFWSNGKAWGTFSQTKNPENGELDYEIKVLYGDLSGFTVKVNDQEIML